MSMCVLEPDAGRAAAASPLGIPWLGWRVDDLCAFLGPSVTNVIIELEDEAEVQFLVRALRAAVPDATIMVAVRDASLKSAILKSGASGVIDEASIVGGLLAEAVAGATPAGVIAH